MSRRRASPRLLVPLGLLLTVPAVVVVVRGVDTEALRATVRAASSDPVGVGAALAAFAGAFLLRSVAWRLVLPGLPLGQALAALHVALGANHVLPFRLGEPLRVVSVVRRVRTPLAPATASTLTLRTADILAMGVLGAVVAPAAFADLLGPWGWAVLALVAAGAAAGVAWLRRLAVLHPGTIRLPGLRVAALTGSAWLAEAVVIWQVAHWAGVPLSASEAVLVTSAAVAAQVLAFAPSGFGTYEAAATAAFVALGHDAGTGLAAALTAHALKTAYSLVAGAVAVVLPAPSLLGRFRLASRELPARPVATPPDGPVVLFLPARDEEAAVAAVVERAPASVAGRPVRVVVIDDHSSDSTAARAVAAGADVRPLPGTGGLGAGVRYGLRLAVEEYDAAVVAFCDADEEYDPAELERLVGPILGGEADYVVGSRFAGRIDRMLPHRRVGNQVLTLLLRVCARTPVTDGQSGYRALSRAAAADAEIVHDFNYAQVLTLDLLGKGFRYAEVPISYRFRTTGRSFVRLVPYLRRVLPAVYRELNAPARTPVPTT